MAQIDRREFLKLLSAAIGSLVLPISLASPITIVDVQLVDGWEHLLKMSKVVHHKRNEIDVEFSFDTDRIWSFVQLIDDNGELWITPDSGHTWQSGILEFQVED